MAIVALAGLRQSTPARRILPAQRWRRRENSFALLLQHCLLRRGNARLPGHPDPGTMQGDRPVVPIVLDRKRVPEQCCAIDFHRVGRHSPAFGAAQLDALRSHAFPLAHRRQDASNRQIPASINSRYVPSPVKLARFQHHRAGLQLAALDAIDRYHLRIVAGRENLVGVHEVGNLQRRFLDLDTGSTQQLDRASTRDARQNVPFSAGVLTTPSLTMNRFEGARLPRRCRACRARGRCRSPATSLPSRSAHCLG